MKATAASRLHPGSSSEVAEGLPWWSGVLGPHSLTAGGPGFNPQLATKIPQALQCHQKQ